VFLLLLDDSCKQDGHTHGNPQPRRARWHERLFRCVQLMAVYLGDGYLAAEGCRGDVLCAAPEYFEDAIRESRRRRQSGSPS
jgi:hypothetical protein